MEKIFVVTQDLNNNEEMKEVNELLENGWETKSVTAQIVSGSSHQGYRGRWLVVLKKVKEEEILP